MNNPFSNLFGFRQKIKVRTETARSKSYFEDNSQINNSISQLFSVNNNNLTILQSCWSTNDKKLHKYANNNILQQNYSQILERLRRNKKYSDSKYPKAIIHT